MFLLEVLYVKSTTNFDAILNKLNSKIKAFIMEVWDIIAGDFNVRVSDLNELDCEQTNIYFIRNSMDTECSEKGMVLK